MTTREAIYKTALEHIRDGSDMVCFDCGWMGNQTGLTYENAPRGGVRKVCPNCGNLPIKGHRHMAAYALAQGEKGE